MAGKREDRPPPRRRAREALPDSPNPVDIAMAAAASGKPLPDLARRVLEEQAELLSAQRLEMKLRHVGEIVRAALWAMLALVAFALIAFIIALVVRASRSDALIVEGFRVPPTLESRGLSGEVVATQLLDRLAQMEEQSDSIRTAKTYGNNWGDELKIDIPNTRATADQLWRLLRGWLGSETRISGEVTQTPEGLVLTTRVGTRPGQRFVSKSGDLQDLTRQGSEYIYKATQPYRYSVYIARLDGREAERQELLEELTRDPSATERKWAFNGLNRVADGRGHFRRAEYFARRMLAIDPNMYVAYTNLGFALWSQGRDQEAADVFQRIDTITISDEFDANMTADNRCADRAQLAFIVMDPKALSEAAACMRASINPGYPGFGLFAQAAAEALKHDPRLPMAIRPAHFGDAPAIDAEANSAELRLRGLMLSGPSPRMSAAMDEYVRTGEARAAAYPQARSIVPIVDWPMRAEALAMLGRTTEAQALITRTPRNCYTCLRVRGLVAKAAGDRATAQRWFLEAARQGPRLAPAFLDWGRLLLDNRRYGSAAVKMREASRLAPNWADPLKYWGDVLAAQGKRDQAREKYDAALQLAPNWAELRQARARLARPS